MGRRGHANAATTLNVYSAFMEASDRDTAELLVGIPQASKSASSRMAELQ